MSSDVQARILIFLGLLLDRGVMRAVELQDLGHTQNQTFMALRAMRDLGLISARVTWWGLTAKGLMVAMGLMPMPKPAPKASEARVFVSVDLFDEEDLELCLRLFEDGLTLPEIGKAVGRAAETVSNKLKEHMGVKVLPNRRKMTITQPVPRRGKRRRDGHPAVAGSLADIR